MNYRKFFFLLFSQGVDLSNIVTESLAADHPLIKSIAKLKNLTDSGSIENNLDEVKQLCNVLSEECRKG